MNKLPGDTGPLMPATPDFVIRYEAVDATVGGIGGVRPDVNRQMVRGIAHYYVDGREVSQAEYERLLTQARGRR